MTEAERIEAANRVLDLMKTRSRIERRPGGFYLVTRHWQPEKPDIINKIVLSKSREFLGLDYGRHGMGMTNSISTAQLVRWIRGERRHPLKFWRYQYSDAIAAILEATDYPDPERTCCVLCRKEPTPAGDWWDDRENDLFGPCCYMEACRRR